MLGALHGPSWIPQQWLDNLENKAQPPSRTRSKGKTGFFNEDAVDALLAAAGGDSACRTAGAVEARAGAGGQGTSGKVAAGADVVYTTHDMGRDAAVKLARLLAQLDCRAAQCSA
jgi:hypothetical protein